jgi:hypothetical protein
LRNIVSSLSIIPPFILPSLKIGSLRNALRSALVAFFLINRYLDPRIELFKNSHNSGSAALNFINSLLSLSDLDLNEYEYISFSDQDDLWIDCKLKCAIQEIVKNKVSLYASNLTIWNIGNNKKKSIIFQALPY